MSPMIAYSTKPDLVSMPAVAVDAVPLREPTHAELVLELVMAGKKPLTRENYHRALGHLATFLGQPSPLAAVRTMIEGGPGKAYASATRWRAAQRDAGDAPSTINVRLAALRVAMTMARLAGVISWEFSIKSETYYAYRDCRGPGIDAVREALTKLAEGAYAGDWRLARALVATRLMFEMGLRRAEVAGLTLQSLDLQRGTVSVIRKWRRDATIMTIPKRTLAVVNFWLAVRGDLPGDALVCQEDGTAMHPTYVNKIIERALKRVDCGHIRPHGLRHTGATTLAKSRSFVEVAAWGGWKKRDTVGYYMDAADDAPARMADALADELEEDAELDK